MVVPLVALLAACFAWPVWIAPAVALAVAVWDWWRRNRGQDD